ncbi:MAG: hypothetical protein E7K04_00435 [Helicobacter sp.]|nr:hypothetical protein [Helicobacter sp.]
MKRLLLTSLFLGSSAFAIGIGNYQITPEIGASFGTQNTNETKFTYGGYARVWAGISRIVFAPSIKYDVMAVKNATNYNNTQLGGLVGFEVPILPLTPYVGVHYSKFSGVNLNNTFAINYGVKVDVPILPFVTVGLEGTWQKPRDSKDPKHELPINRGTFTIGLAF